MVPVILQATRTYFDNPFQKIFVFRYQITERQVESGNLDQYIVVGKTFFGINIVKARVNSAGSAVTL